MFKKKDVYNLIILFILLSGIILYFPLSMQQKKEIQFCKNYLNSPVGNFVYNHDYLYYKKIDNKCCSFNLINDRIKRICKQI